MVAAIVLAGGLGTRLAQTVPNLPKALAPIQGIPFLQLLLRQLENSSIVSQIIFALGHKASFIQEFLHAQNSPMPLRISIESFPLGTGGALLHALDQINEDVLLVLNGDTYFDLSFSDFFNFHRNTGADITIACRKTEDTSRYGSVIMDASFRVLSFFEKSSAPQPGWISGGIYLIQKALLTSFAPGVHSLENDFFPTFLEKKFFAFPQEGSFIDIGTANSYNEAQEILKPLCKPVFKPRVSS